MFKHRKITCSELDSDWLSSKVTLFLGDSGTSTSGVSFSRMASRLEISPFSATISVSRSMINDRNSDFMKRRNNRLEVIHERRPRLKRKLGVLWELPIYIIFEKMSPQMSFAFCRLLFRNYLLILQLIKFIVTRGQKSNIIRSRFLNHLQTFFDVQKFVGFLCLNLLKFCLPLCNG